jgi:hypothetical protein
VTERRSDLLGVREGVPAVELVVIGAEHGRTPIGLAGRNASGCALLSPAHAFEGFEKVSGIGAHPLPLGVGLNVVAVEARERRSRPPPTK